MHAKFYSENLEGRDHLRDLGADRRMILKLIFMNVWIGLI